MSRKNKAALADRVLAAAEAALAAQDAVSVLDVLLGIRWLDPNVARRWRRGQIDCLEDTMQTNPLRIAEALALLRSWASERGLTAIETDYLAQSPQRQSLRFTRSGDSAAERLYRTHWSSPEVPEKKRQRLAEKASAAPELVAVLPLNSEWTCHRCGGRGDFLMMENAGPSCLRCVGLDDLEFLPAGEALLTRRAKARSARHAVVVRFSKSRGRYERQGLLVEPRALAETRRELEEQGRERRAR